MLLVDPREGSKHLVEPLRRAGFDVDDTIQLTFGDVAFVGRGPGGVPVNVGVELKVLSDLINSLRTNRLAGHQLPGLVGTAAAFDYCWLIVQGAYGVDGHGRVTLPRRGGRVPGHMYLAELEGRIITLEVEAGIYYRHTLTTAETVRFIGTLYRRWTDRDQDQHRSHIAVHRPSSVVPLSDFRQAVATRWPHIGIRTSLYVERAFGASITRAATASVKEWAEIHIGEGDKRRRFGTKAAEEIVGFLRGDP